MRRLSTPAIVCSAYFVLHLIAQLSARLFEVAPGISIWYPPCGLAFSLLVLLGPRYAGVVFLANVVGARLTAVPQAYAWEMIAFPAMITTNYAGVAWLVRRCVGPKLLPGTKRETLVFSLAMGGGPAGIALAGTGVLLLRHFTTPEMFWQSVAQWWVGDASGLLTVVPVAIVFVRPLLDPNALPRCIGLNRRLAGVIALQAGVLIGCLWLVFALDPLPQYNAFYLCFLPLIWICLRHGLPGATLATLAVTMGSLIGMHLTGSSTQQIVSFLLFELTVAVVGLGLGSTVTRRNEVERSLAASEARFDRVIAGAQLGVWDWNVATQHAVYNRRWAEMLGYQLEEIAPHHGSWEERIHPADRARVAATLAAHLDGRSPLYEVEYRIRMKDSHWRWMHSRGSVVSRGRRNEPLLMSGTHLDISDRKRAEAEALRLLEILEATTDFVLTADEHRRIRHVNTALLRLLGRPDLASVRGRPLAEILPPAALASLERDALPAALATGSWHGEIALRDAQGREVPVSQVLIVHRDGETDAATLSFVMRDISRQKQAEAEKIEDERKLLRVQKSESLGVLAGGIAHDFNNLLTAMLGNANLARLDLDPASPVHAPLAQIEKAAARAAELCQQMLAYAGRSPLSFTEVDLTALIEDTKQLLHVSIGKKITVDLQLARPLAPIRAAPSQMQQVIMNLALNASEAIGENPGRIVIRTSAQHFDATILREQFRAPALAPGMYVCIEVEDTGCGIPEEAMNRIFEPFFTTKFTGHGLGLAAVMGIVKAHSGAIQVTSALGQGSTFRLLFPAVKPTPRPTRSVETGGDEWRGSGCVLVVDDEPGVRNIVARTLETFGFTPIVAADGVEGVEAFRQHAPNLRFVLLDLTMPRMDGEEAFAAMHRLRPEVPVVLMSGFSEKLTLERFSQTKPAGFLAKPFDRKTLQSRLEPLVVDAPAAAPAPSPAPEPV